MNRDFNAQCCETGFDVTTICSVGVTFHSPPYPHFPNNVPIIDTMCQTNYAHIHRQLNEHYQHTFKSLLIHFPPNTQERVIRGQKYVEKVYGHCKEKTANLTRSIYETIYSNITVNIINDADSTRTPAEIIKDVLTHPVDEIRGFLDMLLCSADNITALIDPTQLTIADPRTGKKTHPGKIFSRAIFNFISSFAHRPASDLLSLISILISGIASIRGSWVATGTTILSSLSMLLNPNTTTTFTTRKAALYNLSQVVTIRQTTRFILLASLILLAWRFGGPAFTAFAKIFRLPVHQPHSNLPTSIVVIILGLLTTWLSSSYKCSYLLDFLRTTALLGGGSFVFNNLNDCIIFVTKLIADFATWIGLKTASQPLYDFVKKKNLDKYTRRGGELTQILPKINTFLSARCVGTTGPGTRHFVNEGRELIYAIDQILKDVTATDGAGHLISMLSRYRQQISTAIENSLFSSENSSERYEPYFTLFCGGPRMGKTMFVNSFIQALRSSFASLPHPDGLIRQTCLLANENRWVFSRTISDDFFSGYNKQALIFYDDIFTANNSVDPISQQRHEKDLSEIQGLVSSQPYAPPMPEVGAGVPCPKGTYISPAFVIATSNFMLANTGCRESTIIDDRIHELILVTHDPEIRKDATFSHLRFHRCVTSVSNFRQLHAARGGWIEPYSPRKQFPITHAEFDSWNMSDLFQEITPYELILQHIEGHKQKLLEMQIRRNAVDLMLMTDERDYIDEMAHSYENECTRLGLIPCHDFRARCLAYGIQEALTGTQTPDGSRLYVNANGPITFTLARGLFGENVSIPVQCQCPGGHTSLVLCPHFKNLQYVFRFTVRKDGTPLPEVPCYTLMMDTIMRTQVPLPLNDSIWRVVTTDLSRYVADLPIVDDLEHLQVSNMQQEYSGPVVVMMLKKRVGIGFIEKDKIMGTYVNDLGVVREFHRNNAVAINPGTSSHAAPFSGSISDTALRIILDKRSDEEPLYPSDEELETILWACSMPYHGGSLELTPTQLRILQSEYNIPLNASLVNPDARHLMWVVNIREKLMSIITRRQLQIPMLDELIESEIYTMASTYGTTEARFQWFYLTAFFLQSVKISLEMRSPIYFVKLPWDEKGRQVYKNGYIHFRTHPSTTISVVPVGRRILLKTLFETDYVKAWTKEMRDTYAPALSSLVDFANVFAGHREPSWLERLSNGLWSLWDLIVKYRKFIFAGLAAFAGAFIITSLSSIGSALTPSEPHAAAFHHPRLAYIQNWPTKYVRILMSVEHPNASQFTTKKGSVVCRLCRDFSKVTHSSWDKQKETTIINELIRLNKSNPNLHAYLHGMLNFNSECVAILQESDERRVETRLLELARSGRVPYTHSGKTRHLYIYRAWQCMNSRNRAIEAIRAQSMIIANFLGNNNDSPIYQADLTFPKSCEIDGQVIECCAEYETCVHREHAYVLPDEPIKYSKIDKTIALASSGSGHLLVDSHVVGRGTIIADGVIITAAHVLAPYLNGDFLIGWRGQTRFNFLLTEDRVRIIANHDIMLIKTESDELPPSSYRGIFKEDKPTVGTKVSIIKLHPNLEREPITAEILPGKVRIRELENQILISKHLEPGDSGSLVIQGGRLIGHYWGQTQEFGVVCYWPSFVQKHVSSLANSDYYDSRFVQYVDETHGFAVLDEYDTRSFDSSPPACERKTELYPVFESMGIESTKAPASQTIEALTKSINKWQPVEEDFDADYALAADEFAAYLETQIGLKQGICKPFETWDDAVNGCELNESRKIKKIDMSTSAGAPWCDNGIQKCEFIDDSNPDRLTCKPDFTELLDKVHTLLLNGDVKGYTATANNKDELRDLKRVAEKKTRLFCATPIHHNIMFRKYYGRWISAFKSLDYNHGMHAMGTDVFGTDWDDLYNYLMSPPYVNESNPVFLAGDFSRFDTSHSGWKLRKAFMVAAAACENKDMCDKLALSITRFALRFDNKEFKVPAGLPSGCQMTTPINCILNILLWLTIWRKATGQGLHHFIENTRLIVYGDDVVWGIDKNSPYMKYLAPNKIRDYMRQLGYQLEPSEGQDEIVWSPIEAITFLKRKFVLGEKGVVHAPRPLADIYTQLMWRRDDPTIEGQECCFRAFAMEIGQHDKEIQNEARATLLRAIPRTNSDLMVEAYSRIPMQSVMDRAYRKKLELSDLVRLRQLFWRLW